MSMRARTLAWLATHALVASALIAWSARDAHAQQATGFALDRYEPSERGSDWFTSESLDLRGDKRLALGLVLDYGYRPLAIYNADGSFRSAIVSDQLVSHVGGAIVFGDRLRVGLNLPVSLYQTGDGGTVNGARYAAPGAFNAGDFRLGVDVRLFGKYGDAVTGAAGFQAWLPTGSRGDYTGDGSARIGPRLMVAGEVGAFAYAARLGVVYRGLDESFAGAAQGSVMTWGASAGLVALGHALVVGPELFGSATIGDQVFKTRTTPVEGLLGAHYTVARDWKLGAGVGAGLTRGYGAPVARGLLSVEWAPAIDEPKPPPSDRDGDGILDSEDACPDQKGVRTPDPTTNGCPPPPPPADRDGDGVLDAVDACPDTPGVPTDDPTTNGCPPPADRDHDGVLDAVDACPDTPGVATSDPKTNGCPPDPDRDKDGIPNDQDACPDQPGKPDPDPKRNGCPAAMVKNNQIVILDQVKFATASAVILPASDAILNAVLKVLTDHPEIKKVGVEGHTDNAGAADYNKQLSAARAASVVTWLVRHGVARERLSSAGFGMERPIDTNSTAEGRQNNRRVEFHIEPLPPPSP